MAILSTGLFFTEFAPSIAVSGSGNKAVSYPTAHRHGAPLGPGVIRLPDVNLGREVLLDPRQPIRSRFVRTTTPSFRF